jgi:hypothetical protein
VGLGRRGHLTWLPECGREPVGILAKKQDPSRMEENKQNSALMWGLTRSSEEQVSASNCSPVEPRPWRETEKPGVWKP